MKDIYVEGRLLDHSSLNIANVRSNHYEILHSCINGTPPIRSSFPDNNCSFCTSQARDVPLKEPQEAFLILARLLFLQLDIIIFMKKYHLGEFEEVVILTIGILHNEAYSVAIKTEIESRLKRSVSMGALHTALRRLEDKGYLKSFAGDSTEERAGRPKRFFEITAMGKKAMQYTKETRDQLWLAIPKTVFKINFATE